MSLDSRFVIAPSLQEIFVNKNTGLLAAGGTVTYYSDNNRDTLKRIYTISGAAPNYEYVDIPNPNTLSGVGTTTDADGNDVLPYYFPYEGDQENSGDVELYYIVVKDSGGTVLFTREGYPNLVNTQTSDVDLTNYIPNGQLFIHNNIAANPLATPPTVTGQVTQLITNVAQGGHTFERTTNNATDIITFNEEGYVVNPTGNPRYQVQIQCTSPSGSDTDKSYRIKFPDVNKFSSTEQMYTFSFTMRSLSGSTLNDVNINLYKYFGTGGSTPTTTNLETISITTTSAIYNIPFTFGVNNTETINPDNDNTDFLQLCIAFPPGVSFNVEGTDFILTPNDVEISQFPVQTNAAFLYQALSGWVNTPDYDGMDLYLPPVLTPAGMTFDRSQIGFIYASTKSSLPISYLNADGAQYPVAGYSSDLIPYRRLFNEYWNDTTLVPVFGTGPSFMTAFHNNGVPSQFRISSNSIGTITTPFTDHGTGNTAVSFTPGINDISLVAFVGQDGESLLIRNKTAGYANQASGAGNSGFTVRNIRDIRASQLIDNMTTVTNIGDGGSLTASHYFLFSNTTNNYYLWWKIDGSGSDPSVGGAAGIEVDLLSTDTAQDVCFQIVAAINSATGTNITCVAASAITGGTYFTLKSTSSLSYNVYYKKDGVGTAPALAGAILNIEVDIAAADTAAIVATKTITAINRTYFAVPDFRGMYLRGAGQSNFSANPQPTDYYLTVGVNYGSSVPIIGALQFDEIYSHTHIAFGIYGPTIGRASGSDTIAIDAPASYTGGSESRPVSNFVNWIVKY